MWHYQVYQHMYNRNFKGQGEKKRGRKNIWRYNGWKHSKFNEIYESTHPRSWITPNRKKSQTHTETHNYCQKLKLLNLENSKKEATYNIQPIHNKINNWFLFRYYEGQRADIFRVLKEKIVNQEFYTYKIILQKWRR